MQNLKLFLETLYKRLNKREFSNPDPIIFLYDYPNRQDREIIGLIASSLAYGRASQILKSINKITLPMQKRPYDFVISHSKRDFEKIYENFAYRFVASTEIVNLFSGIKAVLKEYENFENLYLEGVEKFADFINFSKRSYLIPNPREGSACKRLNLYFRWMVREDEVDPGGWRKADPAKLTVPLDTHAFKAAKILGFTKKRAINYKTALEVTERFAEISPKDPVKYDFALTRFGIRSEISFDDLIKELFNDQTAIFETSKG